MSDIIERLMNSGSRSEAEIHEDREEAADLIRDLRAQLAQQTRTISAQEAAATLYKGLTDPDLGGVQIPGFKDIDWQKLYSEMTADHTESLEIAGVHDWPSLLITAFREMSGMMNAEEKSIPSEVQQLTYGDMKRAYVKALCDACAGRRLISRLLEERAAYRDALSNLALYLAVGSGDEATSAESYEKRIRLGIDMLNDPLIRMIKTKNEEIASLKECLVKVSHDRDEWHGRAVDRCTEAEKWFRKYGEALERAEQRIDPQALEAFLKSELKPLAKKRMVMRLAPGNRGLKSVSIEARTKMLTKLIVEIKHWHDRQKKAKDL